MYSLEDFTRFEGNDGYSYFLPKTPIDHILAFAIWKYGESNSYKKSKPIFDELAIQFPDLNLNNSHINGYVLVDFQHKFTHYHYNDLDLEVHGGLTFSKDVNYVIDGVSFKGRAFGFDTAHAFDTPKYWTEERVIEETLKLLNQMVE